jgi:hypothetical protein
MVFFIFETSMLLVFLAKKKPLIAERCDFLGSYNHMSPLRAGFSTLRNKVAGRSQGQFPRASLHAIIFD